MKKNIYLYRDTHPIANYLSMPHPIANYLSMPHPIANCVSMPHPIANYLSIPHPICIANYLSMPHPIAIFFNLCPTLLQIGWKKLCRELNSQNCVGSIQFCCVKYYAWMLLHGLNISFPALCIK